MSEEKKSRPLFIGWDADTGEKVEITLDQPVVKNPHVVVFGQPGSGKTVFCKALIEEASRNGIPCFVVDPQGDLSSLAIMGDVEKLKERGVDEDIWTSYKNHVSVAILTPASSKGIPISVNPIKLPEKKEASKTVLTEEEVIQAIEGATTALCSFLHFDPEKDDGRLVSGFLNRLFKYYYDTGESIADISTLATVVEQLPGDASKLAEGYIKSSLRQKLGMLLRASLEGMRGHLLTHGVQLDIERLIQPRNGKTPVNIFYLNTLPSVELKQFFIAVLVNQIYQWMLTQTSSGEVVPLRLILYIDEAAPFIPSGMSKPPAKRALQPLLTQSRKYGVGIFFSTQTPGSMDGYMLGQANTIVTGQLQTDLDLRRVDEIVEAMMKEATETVLQKIRLLPAGNFFLMSPQQFPKMRLVRTRWLVTEHKIVPDEVLRDITDKDAIAYFAEEIEEANERVPAPVVVEEIPSALIQKEKEELKLEEIYLKTTCGTVTREMLEASLSNPSRIVLVPKKRFTLYIPVLAGRGKVKLRRELMVPALEKLMQIDVDMPLNRFILLSQSIPLTKYVPAQESPDILLTSSEMVFDESDIAKAIGNLRNEQELSPPSTPLSIAIQRDLRKTMENITASFQSGDSSATKDQLLNEWIIPQASAVFTEIKRKIENEVQRRLDELRSAQRESQDNLQKLKERLMKIDELTKKARTEEAKASITAKRREIEKNIRELNELKKDAMDKTQLKIKESENLRASIDRIASELLRIQKEQPQEILKPLGITNDLSSWSKFTVDNISMENGLILRTPVIIIEGEVARQNEKGKFVAVAPGRGRCEAHGVCLYQEHGEGTRPLTLCKTCLTEVCEMHRYTCTVCGEPLCPDDSSYCNKCGVVLCNEHKKTCDYEHCKVTLCDSHATQCENCKQYFCEKHIHETKVGPIILRTTRLLCDRCMK
jgi:GTPase SAR1 family protein